MRLKCFFYVAIVFLSIGCHHHYVPHQYSNSNQKIEKVTLSESNQIKKFVAPYKHRLDSIMNQTLVEASDEFTKKPVESSLGNLMCDAMVWYARERMQKRVDFSIVNYGGIRIQSISKGPVSLGKIYELMPFENMMTFAFLNGEQVNQLIYKMTEFNGWPVSAELHYAIDERTHPFDIRIQNQPLLRDSNYVVLLSDYLMDGGDKLDFLKEAKREVSPILIRDAIIEYCKYKRANNQVISPVMDGRVTLKKNAK